MKKEQINEFTMRITQSNRTQLVVVMYDIFLTYISEAKEYHSTQNIEQYKASIDKANLVITELISCLNFKYEISAQLLKLYKFIIKSLSKAKITSDTEHLNQPIKTIDKLKDSFEKISKEDKSPVLMKNSQKVFAGLTYGKESLNEVSEDKNRGFLA